MAILIQLLEIITLRRRPQDINYDSGAALLTFIGAMATGYFQVIAARAFAQPLPFVLAQGITQCLIFFVILSLAKKQIRFIQTITALFGVSAILQFLGLIILQVPGLAMLGLFITSWNFYLMILILRDAVGCNTIQAIIITIAYHFLIGLVLLMLFPDIFQQMQAMMNAAKSV